MYPASLQQRRVNGAYSGIFKIRLIKSHEKVS